MSLETVAELRSNASDLESYERLYEEEKQLVDSLQKKNTASSKRVSELTAKRDALKAKVAEAKAAKKNNTNSKGNNSAASSTSGYQQFVEQAASLYKDLALRKSSFKYVSDLIASSPDASNGGASNIRYADLGKAIEYHEGWTAFDAALDDKISDFTSLYNLKFSKGDVNPSKDLTALAEEVRDLHSTIAGHLTREASRRNNHANNMQELRDSQSKIMLWCRQQRSTMENLKEAGQIQEYTNSFQSNITVMETNFLVLMELAEPLLPNKEVNKVLEDVIEVWLSLQVFAFEKLNATIMEQHEASHIEADLNRWLEHEGNVVSFLNKAREVLSMPVDDESKEVTQPILETCDKLLADIESFSIIVGHLSSFTLREANLKEYHDAIRRTIFSKLTLTTQVYNGQFSFPRKQEYMDRLAELNDWVDCKSQNNAWKQLLQRVDHMKTLIEENKSTHGTAEERGY